MSKRPGVVYTDAELEAKVLKAASDADANRAEPAGAAYGEATTRMLYWAAVREGRPDLEVIDLRTEWERELLRLRWEEGRQARDL